jgi:catalase
MIREVATAVGAILILGASAAVSAEDPVVVEIVDALNKHYGVHQGFRANHAKGVVVEGTFTPAPGAKPLSRSPLFAGGSLPVTIRFSNSGGVPDVPDGSPDANPHGMAIKFHLPNNGESDIVINSLKFFPVATPEDFRDLQLAAATLEPGKPPSAEFKAFLDKHPSVLKAVATAATPASFATEHYYGINAFIFVDKAGHRQAFRYIVEPEKLVHLSAADAAKQSPDFLIQELPQRLAKGPVKFHVRAQLAAPSDPTNDATQPWPDDRKVVDLGTFTISKAVPDSLAAQKKLLFLPGRVTDGIEVSDDALINARDGAYAVSFGRRSAP